ncbi:MAG TPA: hypothetical protein VG897_03850 [Terriglobales bacterium]|nr:hypothetical protein [Terriglobales bacterium]
MSGTPCATSEVTGTLGGLPRVAEVRPSGAGITVSKHRPITGRKKLLRRRRDPFAHKVGEWAADRESHDSPARQGIRNGDAQDEICVTALRRGGIAPSNNLKHAVQKVEQAT